MNIPGWHYCVGAMIGLVIVLLLWRRCAREDRQRRIEERRLEEVTRQGRG